MTLQDLPRADVKAILWDFGGVFTGSPFYSVDNYAEKLGIERELLVQLVLGYGIPDGDHHWHKLERGEIPMIEAAKESVRAVRKAGVQNFNVKDFFASMGGKNENAGEMFEGVKRYKELGIKQFILSNNIREFGKTWKAMLPEGLFDGIVDSCEVGVRKPDPEIFKIALTKAETPPNQTVFLDDYPEHVEVARSMGITGVNVGANPLDALKELDALLNVS
ncbi:MAG: HAD family phosphatase [Acidimicrobiales bacterium]|nr:HAD family phosphatase [Acidimicrobiales bacterium]MDP6299062.1 HAD family phosphatase [Acidimicrobiales bacterium]HJM28168.1 HAD family phosphatase [Acidimicrobiales bacterium]HJM97581.1 HAD family phosphatase [Acidimicrobiales bacterium]